MIYKALEYHQAATPLKWYLDQDYNVTYDDLAVKHLRSIKVQSSFIKHNANLCLMFDSVVI